VTLKTPWRDGTTHLCFEPVTLLERLAALTPRPRINVVLYHGVLAPRAKWRASAVTYGRADAAATQDDAASIAGPVTEVSTTSEAHAGSGSYALLGPSRDGRRRADGGRSRIGGTGCPSSSWTARRSTSCLTRMLAKV